MNKLKRSSRLVKSTTVKDPDLFLKHSEKYKLSPEINSQTQLNVTLKDNLGQGSSRKYKMVAASQLKFPNMHAHG